MDHPIYVVKKAKESPEEVSMDLAVLFLLEGTMTVQCQGSSISMQREDILLVSPGMPFELSNIREALYGEAVYSPRIIADLLEGQGVNLYADSARDFLHSYQDLRAIFYDLTAMYTAGNHKTRAAMDSLLYQLLDCLIEHYQLSDDALKTGVSGSDPRMQEIMQYVLRNISSEINLSELADKMFVSTSTLSRIFKKNTGEYFTDYVTKLRVQSSLGLLEHSDQNLTQVALNCGFSDSSTFSRAFKKVTGMNPSDYRQQKQGGAKKAQKEKDEEEKRIREQLKEKGYEQGRQESGQNIAIDVGDDKRLPYRNVWGQTINIGGLYELTRANVQFHVLYLQEQLHFRYIRTWNVFSVRLMITDGKTPDQYSFDVVDQALDFLVQHHLKPFLDFARRPDTALKTEGLPIYYRDEYVPFSSRENWEHLVSVFISHILDRYGQEEVSGWIFELSHDPDHSSTESQIYADPKYDYFDAWNCLFRTVHREIPSAMVGGMSGLIDHDKDYLTRFYERARRNGCLPDFVSFILFPYDEGNGDENGKVRRTLSSDPHFEINKVSEIRHLMEESGLSDKKLFITEWNNSISNRNSLNDACFRAAYLVKKTEELWERTDMLAIIAGSDWVSNYMDSAGIVNGGIGLLTKDTICKPAFYAVQFLNQMGKYFVGKGQHYIATVQDNGDLYILCFYYSGFRHSIMIRDENIDIEQIRNIVFEDDRPLKLKITIDNLKKQGEFYVKRRVLNNKNGSVLDEWGKFQYEKNLTRQDIKYLQDVSMPKILLEKKKVTGDHRMEIEIEMEPQEISILHIYPAR